MPDLRWLTALDAVHVHAVALQVGGGLPGVRDRHLVSASVSRPKFRHKYEEADLVVCAAAYAFAFARNHPFHDGNKRTAFGTMALFLLRNGLSLETETEECVHAMLAVAAGKLSEDRLAGWIRSRVRTA